jgi:excisionase family DNA binding protein
MEDWTNQPTLRVEQAAEILGVSRSSAYEAARAGELPTIRLGRRLLVPTARLRALLGETATGSTATDAARNA